MTTSPKAQSLSTDLSCSAIHGLPPIQPAVSIHGLNYSYGTGANKTHALGDVNLEIDRGEVAILTGPSGSGKTTLLTVIGALRRVDDREVRVCSVVMSAGSITSPKSRCGAMSASYSSSTTCLIR
jgi:ABC-type Fe3+/spermidine/putrescine transport system ATPase subunit